MGANCTFCMEDTTDNNTISGMIRNRNKQTKMNVETKQIILEQQMMKNSQGQFQEIITAQRSIAQSEEYEGNKKKASDKINQG